MSAAFPTGRASTVRPSKVLGSVAISSPAGERTETVLLKLSVTHTRPARSVATPNGFIFGSFGGGVGPPAMLIPRVVSPPGYFVTVSLPQLAIQMLPWRSETVPCGHEMLPLVYPAGPEMAVPSGAKRDTLFFGAACGVSAHGGSWNPKLPTQTLP